MALTFYFFWKSNHVKPKNNTPVLKSKKSRFFLGILLSALNFFPIPFYIFISVTLASYNYFSFEKLFIYAFVFGIGLGSFLAFYCYVAFFKKLETKTAFILNNINYIIGSITGICSIITIINIIKFYCN